MSCNSPDLREGLILQGSLFNEPVRIETLRQNGPDSWEFGLVGLQSERFRKVTLTSEQIKTLRILDSIPSYKGDGHLFRLGLQAYALGIAHEFDPYFGLSVSRVDPLPHQLEAVYDYLLKVPRVQFLLADDAGAGKTIMAGLLIRELKLRGLIERILIVCPANLSFQWERELKDKFDEKFKRLRGSDLDSYSMNQWIENKQVITSLDLAKLNYVLPGLRQCHWDLIIVDEAHRMSARDESHKSLRYRLGELLRDTSDHILLLTATPHKGDPANFSLFLQLLDRDAYADVRSIHEAMERRRAPFYLRRTKEAMVYFPERQPDGTWQAHKIFTKRIPKTTGFPIDGAEFDLYSEVTRFVKRQSAKAVARGDDPRARAIGFLMSLYQRRLASSTYALQRSLENRARRLETALKEAQDLARTAPPDIPDPEEFEEMEDAERERLEALAEAVTLSENSKEIRQEISELRELAERAKQVEEGGAEAKLSKLRQVLQDEGFFGDSNKRLLIFTEFRDTLSYLMERLKQWGFKTGCIHGQMKAGSRDEPGSRLYNEQKFWDGEVQLLGPNLWKARYHVLARSGTAVNPAFIDIANLAPKLRFQGKATKLPKNYSGRSFQSLRKLTSESAAVIREVWIKEYSAAAPVGVDPVEKTQRLIASGFGLAEENRQVEQAAVAYVRKYFHDCGWKTRDVSSSKCGYDLKCHRGRNVVHVEVKGTRGSEQQFILTRNEAETWKHDKRFLLALVTNAVNRPKLFQFQGPRSLTQMELKPIAFVCVPKGS